jgi:hypothetical protein
VVAALIVRGWVEAGCGKATGWVQVLRDPRLSRAIYAMHQQPGINWSVADLAKEAGTSRSVFAERFSLPPAAPRQNISASCVCGWRSSTSAMKTRLSKP